jgi:hypothetical protein
MKRVKLLSFSLILILGISACTTMQSKRIVFEKHPIALRVVSTVVDEEKIVYTIKFRNVGREIVSFDYTIADEAGVPHVDKFGPNSGFVEKLYPGAEVQVPNPMEKMAVFVTLGTVTYGKRTSEELDHVYHPDKFLGTSGSLLNELEGGDPLLDLP